MSQLAGVPGELRMTVTVKRAASGKEETFELIGTPIVDAEVTTQQKEQENGCNPLDRSA